MSGVGFFNLDQKDGTVARAAQRGHDPAPMSAAMGAGGQKSGVFLGRHPLSPMRSRWVVALFGLGFMALLLRGLWLQVLEKDFYLRKGEARFARTLDTQAWRGRIYDRNGVLLASSVLRPSIWVDPEALEALPARRLALAQALGLSPAQLQLRLEVGSRNFAWLKRQASDEQGQKAMALKMAGVHQTMEYARAYPEAEAMAPVLGYTSRDDVGRFGIEAVFDELLAGKDGSQRVIRDGLGKVVETLGGGEQVEDGRDLVLSLDTQIQYFTWSKLREAMQYHKAKAGSAIVIDAPTGEILALVTYPGFNPATIAKTPKQSMINPVVSNLIEPGSTMKAFTVAMGLETKVIRPESVIQTAPGFVKIDNYTIRDAQNYGPLTVQQVIQKSSNVGTIRIAERLQADYMFKTYRALGFGLRPELSYPSVAQGMVRPPKAWGRLGKASISYGYSINASLLQMAQAYTVFARDGDRIALTLLKQAAKPTNGERIFSTSTVEAMRRMLHMVTLTGGTGMQAQTDGYTVGGKTGTAYKYVVGKGYDRNRYNSFFVGLAPIEKPRIVVGVLVEDSTVNGRHGGQVAAPVFGATVAQTLRILGVPADNNLHPQIVTGGVEESN